jgi:hypothetical protein
LDLAVIGLVVAGELLNGLGLCCTGGPSRWPYGCGDHAFVGDHEATQVCF